MKKRDEMGIERNGSRDEGRKCPSCNGKDIIRKGRRKEKFEIVQKYQCKECGENFSSKKLENSTFSPRVIISAISCYNKGMTLEEVSRAINKRFCVRTYPRLISSWIERRKNIVSYKRVRDEEGKATREIIVKKMFVHKQPYMFKYHTLKARKFLTEYFLGLKNYFGKVHMICPNELFNCEDENKIMRCSQIALDVEPLVFRRKNYACRTAEFVLKGINNNYERHDMIEEFLISNDTATVAVEIPVWIFPGEVPDEAKKVFNIDKPLTGHIDILQARYGMIHIMDYKPGAEKVNAVSQLFAYALALSARTGIWLRNFKCAWFDEKDYFEFNPNQIVLSHLRNSKGYSNVDPLILRKYFFDEKARKYYTGMEFHEKNEQIESERNKKEVCPK